MNRAEEFFGFFLEESELWEASLDHHMFLVSLDCLLVLFVCFFDVLCVFGFYFSLAYLHKTIAFGSIPEIQAEL